MKLQPYLQLIRFYQPVGTLLLMWPPLWCVFLLSGDVKPQMDLILCLVLGAFCMRSAGCVINDIVDRELDAKVERTKNRPLASGALSVKQALYTLAVLLTCALGIAIYLGWNVVLASLVALPLVMAYPWMKRITFWPQLFLGLTFNFGVLMASIALTGEIQPTAWWLYAACVFWTLGYDTIYGFQDIKDDEQIGVKSTARLFQHRPKLFITVCYALCVVLMTQVLSHTPMPTMFLREDLMWLGIMIAAHLAWQVHRLNSNDPKICMMLFKSNANIVGPAMLLLCMLWAV